MKRILHSCTALTLSLAFTASALAQEPLKELGAGEGQVNIVAWAGYIERGETDKPSTGSPKFEEEDGLQGQRQDRRHLRRNGRADERGRLSTSSPPRATPRCASIAGKRVQPINTDLIKSWKTIDERLQNAPWHTVRRRALWRALSCGGRTC
jgi:putative spermidine/putrescine transport system substrate-binding protein